MNLSAHFTDSELRCKCKRHKDKQLCNADRHLLSLAEQVRSLLKVPMVVTSCCRCAAHNKEVGGSPTSKHICSESQPARAMDFRPQHSISPLRAYNAIVKAWRDGRLPELGGIGLYDTFLHIDTARAADGHLRTWDERKKKE